MNGWPTKKLGKVCEFKPSKRQARAILPLESMVSFMPMNDLCIQQMYPVPAEDRRFLEVVSSYTYFADGDVLLAKITPCFENGKLGVARGLTNGIGFGSSEFHVLRPKPEVLAEYVYYFLERDQIRENGAKAMTGAVGHRRVPEGFFEELEIPVPPIGEQRRIVADLDEAFAAIATATANAEKNITNVRELFSAGFRAIFDPAQEGWHKNTLPDISQNLDARRRPVTKSDRIAGHVPYYGASGQVDSVKDFLFDDDLLLISEDGANLLMRTYPIAFPISGKSWVNNHAHILKFADSDTQRLTEYYVNSISVAPWVSGMAQPKLNQKGLNAIPIPLPPMEQRRELVARLDTLATEIAAMAGGYRRKVSLIANLRQTLLQRLFAGDLSAADLETIAA